MFEATEIPLDAIHSTAQEMRTRGYRLIGSTVVDLGDKGFDHIYHYDRELEELSFRATCPRGTPVPSISDVYFCAMLAENENRDLFGIEYTDLVLDFNRTLYLEEAGDPLTAPFCKISTFTKLKCEV